MALGDGPLLNTSVVQDKQNNKQVTPTQSAKTLKKELKPSTKARQPFVRHNRLLSIVGIVLLVAIFFSSFRLVAVLQANNNELLVQVAGQQESTVDLRQAFPISADLFGTNVFPAANTESQDHVFSGFMNYGPAIYNGLRNAHIGLLRFPGGTWGTEHVLSYDQLNSFSTLLNQTGADGMIQTYLSAKTGTKPLLNKQPSLHDLANLAGQWVDYMNNPQSPMRTGHYAHAPFHPVKIWTVGNEPDLALDPDTGKKFTVKEYTDAFIQYSIAMHQNDPTIQVFGPEISQFYGVNVGPKAANGQLWMEGFLQGVENYEKAHPQLKFHLLDGVSFHHYPVGDATTAPGILLSSTNEWNYLLPPLRQLIRQDLGRDVPIAVTEINTNPTHNVPTPGIAALWWADTLGSLMSQQVASVDFFSTQGVDTPYPLFTETLSQTAMMRVFQMFSHLQQNYIPVGTQSNPISLYATQDDQHQTVSLLFINKSSSVQLAHVSAKNQFFGLSTWPALNVSLFGNSIILVTLHRNGGAEAYSYQVPTNENSTVNPITFTTCGSDSDVLANRKPC